MVCSIKNVGYEVISSQYVVLKTHEALLNQSPKCYVWSVKYAWFLK